MHDAGGFPKRPGFEAGQGIALSGDFPNTTVTNTGVGVYWREATATAAPNNLVNASTLTPIAATTDADAVIIPKGLGAFQLVLADGTTAGGDKRGSSAVDLQTIRSTASARVASGQQSNISGGANNEASGLRSSVHGGFGGRATNTGAMVLGGNACVSSGLQSVAGGESATASGDRAIAIGNGPTASGSAAIALGTSGTADSANSLALGNSPTTRGIIGNRVWSSSFFSAGGDCQEETPNLRRQSTSATAVVLTTDGNAPSGTTNTCTLSNNSTYMVNVLVVAQNSANHAVWDVTFCATRAGSAATTAIDATSYRLPASVQAASAPLFATAGATGVWTIAIQANTTSGAWEILCTGAAATTIGWGASVRYQRVAF